MVSRSALCVRADKSADCCRNEGRAMRPENQCNGQGYVGLLGSKGLARNRRGLL